MKSSKVDSDSEQSYKVDVQYSWGIGFRSEHIYIDGRIADNKTDYDAPIMLEP